MVSRKASTGMRETRAESSIIRASNAEEIGGIDAAVE
jgi:hypothetical protein